MKMQIKRVVIIFFVLTTFLVSNSKSQVVTPLDYGILQIPEPIAIFRNKILNDFYKYINSAGKSVTVTECFIFVIPADFTIFFGLSYFENIEPTETESVDPFETSLLNNFFVEKNSFFYFAVCKDGGSEKKTFLSIKEARNPVRSIQVFQMLNKLMVKPLAKYEDVATVLGTPVQCWIVNKGGEVGYITYPNTDSAEYEFLVMLREFKDELFTKSNNHIKTEK